MTKSGRLIQVVGRDPRKELERVVSARNELSLPFVQWTPHGASVGDVAVKMILERASKRIVVGDGNTGYLLQDYFTPEEIDAILEEKREDWPRLANSVLDLTQTLNRVGNMIYAGGNHRGDSASGNLMRGLKEQRKSGKVIGKSLDDMRLILPQLDVRDLGLPELGGSFDHRYRDMTVGDFMNLFQSVKLSRGILGGRAALKIPVSPCYEVHLYFDGSTLISNRRHAVQNRDFIGRSVSYQPKRSGNLYIKEATYDRRLSDIRAWQSGLSAILDLRQNLDSPLLVRNYSDPRSVKELVDERVVIYPAVYVFVQGKKVNDEHWTKHKWLFGCDLEQRVDELGKSALSSDIGQGSVEDEKLKLTLDLNSYVLNINKKGENDEI